MNQDDANEVLAELVLELDLDESISVTRLLEVAANDPSQNIKKGTWVSLVTKHMPSGVITERVCLSPGELEESTAKQVLREAIKEAVTRAEEKARERQERQERQATS